MQHFLETGSLKQTLDEAKGKSIRNKTGKDFSYTSLKRLLQNEKFIGIMRVQMGERREPQVVKLKHGCVVPLELFDEIQNKLRAIDEKKRRNRLGTRIFLLSSMLVFEDGTSFSGSSGVGRSGQRHHYYRNKNSDITLDAVALEKAVMEKFRSTFQKDIELEECVSQVQNSKLSQLEIVDEQIKAVEAQVRDIKRDEEKLVGVLMSGNPTLETLEFSPISHCRLVPCGGVRSILPDRPVGPLAGDLTAKLNTSSGAKFVYSYDTFGQLKAVTLPSGQQITYLADGERHRVQKRINGVVQKSFVYNENAQLVGELDNSGSLVSQFAYASSKTSPDLMRQGGSTYRFIKDQLGSIRLVVNVSSAAIVQHLDYNEFGVVTLDTNPGFQPFGLLKPPKLLHKKSGTAEASDGSKTSVRQF